MTSALESVYTKWAEPPVVLSMFAAPLQDVEYGTGLKQADSRVGIKLEAVITSNDDNNAVNYQLHAIVFRTTAAQLLLSKLGSLSDHKHADQLLGDSRQEGCGHISDALTAFSSYEVASV